MPKSYVRLTQPLVRDGDRATGALRPATWDEALERAAGGFRRRSATRGATASACFSLLEGDQRGQLRGPEAGPRGHGQQQHRQLQQDLTRPDVAGLATIFGAGGGTSSYREVEETDLVILWGSNARETHPIFFHHLLRGIHNGARLYAVDPRRTSSRRLGRRLAGPRRRQRHRPGQRRSGARSSRPACRTTSSSSGRRRGFDEYRARVEPYTLEYAERETGVPAARIRELAHAYATAPRAMICWTLGHHRAPQRGRQRPRPHLAGAPHRPRRAATAAASTRCAARTTSRAAATWAPSPTGCRASSTSRTTRCGPASTPPGASRSRRSGAGTCPACSTPWSAAS